MSTSKHQTPNDFANHLTDATVRAMRSWSALAEAVDVPPAIGAAIATCRPELLELVKPEAQTKEEAAILLNLIRVQMRTILQLQKHAVMLAQQAESIDGHMRGLVRSLHSLELFANFKDESW